MNGFILNGLVLHFVLLRTECVSFDTESQDEVQHEVRLSIEGRACPEGFTVNGFILNGFTVNGFILIPPLVFDPELRPKGGRTDSLLPHEGNRSLEFEELPHFFDPHPAD